MSGPGRAVVLGTISADLLAHTDHAEDARLSAGNSGANIAVRLAALGWHTDLIAQVGPDPIADLVRADLATAGVGTAGVLGRDDYRTPRVFHLVDTNSSRLLFTCPRCGAERGHTLDLPDELPSASWRAVEEADVLVVDIAQPLALEAARRTRARLIWYEQSLQEATVAHACALTAQADVVKVSMDDEDYYAPTETFDGPHLWIGTRGRHGVQVRRRPTGSGAWEGAENWPAQAVHAVDSIGAGDAFTAVAIDRITTRGTDSRWLADASAAAARAVSAVGARGDMIDHRGAEKKPRWSFCCAACDQSDGQKGKA